MRDEIIKSLGDEREKKNRTKVDRIKMDEIVSNVYDKMNDLKEYQTFARHSGGNWIPITMINE